MFEMFYFFLWLMLCVLIAYFANEKAADPIVHFLISFFLSPVVGLIFLLMTKDKSAERDIKYEVSKKCKHCAEVIKFEAIKCRYCGEPAN